MDETIAVQKNNTARFFRIIRNPLGFRLFLWRKLPAALFSGLRVAFISENEAAVSVPYKWFTRNPFRSTYFACLSMAAEMSTGVLAMSAVYDLKPGVSLLVTGIQGKFFKKAVGSTRFVCKDGALVRDAVYRALETGEAQTLIMRSEGFNKASELVASFDVEWSFKKRKN
jgi:Domain of unknown function (DUF4442)